VNRIFLSLAFAFLLFTVPVFGADKGVALTGLNRVALVVGNSAYKFAPLRNPVNDARTMRDLLKRAGFRVTLLENASKRRLLEAVRSFGSSLRQSDAALFYFSGHGLQQGGRNWLLPVDSDIRRESDVEFEAVSADRVLAEMEGGTQNRVNLVIVDACRNNPAFRSLKSIGRGLVQPRVQPQGSLVAFATAPGTVAYDGEGRNSPYVSELKKHLLTPGLKVEEVFKRVRAGVMRLTAQKRTQQVPWESSSLIGDFYFVRGSALSTDLPSPSTLQTGIPSPSTLQTDLPSPSILTVSSNVYGDEVYIDGVLQGSTKLTVSLSPGKHRVEVKKRGYLSYDKTFLFKGGKAYTIKAALRQKQESTGMWTEPVTGMKFRKIPGGSFLMGSPSSEEDRDNDETQHTVRVGEFWLGETEVTQAQWQAVMGSNPSRFRGSDLPVEKVSWNDIQEFIKRLNGRTGKRFRLPTEAEWEYACREGGRKVRYCNGKDKASKSEINYGGRETEPVASFAPNSLGLYDMSGNVAEWTCSASTESYYGIENLCVASAHKYSLRGGSWINVFPGGVRAASRYFNFPAYRSSLIGFRLARD